MDIKYQKVKKILKTHNQESLLQYYDQLTIENKNNLLDQILNIDFEFLNKLYINSFNDEEINKDMISNMPYIDINDINSIENNKYNELGLSSIKNNEYAVVIMAGGSGSRLGHNGPKGTYTLSLGNEEKTFFEIFIDQLISFQKKNNIYINLYLMTSKDNHLETIEYFSENNYLNYPKNKIHFFIQDELPILDKEGNCMLSEKHTILTGPNGNGDIFSSLKKSGQLEKMKKNGIKWVFICGIDNILTKLIDPLLLGVTIFNNYKLTSKTIFKKEVNSKDGVFALKNNKPYILNYWDIDEEMSNLKEHNKYLYRDINIANHLISMDLMLEFANSELPYHRAFKKSSYIDGQGNKIDPENANSFKFEKFIFDAFSLTEKMLLLRVNEKESFAPVKNKVGINSVETAVKLYLENMN